MHHGICAAHEFAEPTPLEVVTNGPANFPPAFAESPNEMLADESARPGYGDDHPRSLIASDPE
jgi:hypothetical protein